MSTHLHTPAERFRIDAARLRNTYLVPPTRGDSTRGRLLLLLQDGASACIEQAAAAMRDGEGDGAEAQLKLCRAEALISQLEHALDGDQGSVARNMRSILAFCRRHLCLARARNDARKLDEVVLLLGQMRDAWDSVPAA